MPPKKKPKLDVAASPPASSKSPAKALDDEKQDKDVPGTIGDAVFRVSENVAKIIAHPVFKGIMTADALSLSDGGGQEPYSDDNFKKVFAKGAQDKASYACGMNFMWIDHAKRAMTGVPITKRAVDKLMLTTRILRGDLDPLDIAVNSADDLPSKRRGALERLTPPDESFALLELIRQDVDGDETEKLKMWRGKVLSMSVRIRIMPEASAKWWFEYNLREEIGERYESIYQTTYQKVCAVITLVQQVVEKEGHAAATPAKILSIFNKSATTLNAPSIVGAESISETFIREVVTVRDSLFSNARVRWIIAEMDELEGHGSVFNSVYKLAAIKRIAKTAPMIEWVMEALRDAVLSESSFLNPRPSQRDFTGIASPKNVVGTIVAKKQFLDLALNQAAKWFPHSITSKMVEVFSSYEQFRAMRPIKGDSPPLLWMADWGVAPRLFMEFISQAVFGFESPYLWAFQQVSRKGRCVSSLLEGGPLNEEWERIKRVLDEAEKEAKVKAQTLALEEAAGNEALQNEGGKSERPGPTSGDCPVGTDPVGSQNPASASKDFWMKYAQETVRSRVVLKKMPETEAELTEALKTSDVAALHIIPGMNTILKVWDEKLSSEAAQAPHLRKSPHRPGLFKRCLHASVASTNGVMAKSELYLVFDHGKATMYKNGQKAFEGIEHHHQHYELQLDEESLVSRRRRMKGKKPLIKQTEKLFVYTADKKYIPENTRMNYRGTNRGQQWGFIVLPPITQVWRLKPDEKKLALGDAIRPVGGRAVEDACDDDNDSEDEGDPQQEDNLVPFAYHALPATLADSVVDSFKARGGVDLTPGDGTLAEAVLEAKDVLYLGFCHTESHCDLLRNRLSEQVMMAMQQEGNPLFNVLCVKELKKGKADQAATAGCGSSAKTDEKDQDKKNAKKKKKKGKKKSSSSSSSSPAGALDDD